MCPAVSALVGGFFLRHLGSRAYLFALSRLMSLTYFLQKKIGECEALSLPFPFLLYVAVMIQFFTEFCLLPM